MIEFSLRGQKLFKALICLLAAWDILRVELIPRFFPQCFIPYPSTNMESSCRISITDGLSPEPLPTPIANEFMADNSTAPTIFPSPKDLSEEAEDFLAGANGNFYLSQPGVEGVHDGRIMIRLKKKRFIVIDYSCVPSPQDETIVAGNPNIAIPRGAGREECIAQDCSKVGIPVLLYDSDPQEQMSLYLRSGLCFTCQRVLNEKRRTVRKRKIEYPIDWVEGAAEAIPCAEGERNGLQRQFRVHGEIVDISPDAIVISGPLEGTRHHGPGYEYGEIKEDLCAMVKNVSSDMSDLLLAMTPPEVGGGVDVAKVAGLYEKAFLSMSKGIFLLSQWKASWDNAVYTAAALAAQHQAMVQYQQTQMAAVARARAQLASTTAAVNESVASIAAASAVASNPKPSVGRETSNMDALPHITQQDAMNTSNNDSLPNHSKLKKVGQLCDQSDGYGTITSEGIL